MMRSQRGSATIEAAFALPIALALIGSVLFAGWLGAVQTVLSHGAREGARFAAIPSSIDLRTWPTEAQLFDAVDAATPMLRPTRVRLIEQPGARNAPLRVEVTYEVSNPAAALLAPLRVLGVGDGVPPTITMHATAEVRRE